MKKSELLRLAKGHLWDGKGKEPRTERKSKSPYICIAALKASRKHRVDYSVVAELEHEIQEMLCLLPNGKRSKNMTLRGWLADALGVGIYEIPNEPMQIHRHQWLDRLIAMYKLKGE